MASSFTTSFGIEKIATGEQAGVWGTTTNFNIDILDRIASFTSVALSGTTQTLTVREASPGAGTENLQDGMYRVIKFTGALGGNNTVTIAPNTSKAWFIFENATTDSGSSGPYSVILTQGAGANITVQNGKNAIVYCDGAGSGAAVFNALNDLQIATLEVTGAAAVDGLLTAGASVAVTGNVTTTGTVEPAGDTAADDNAAIGYTAGEGLILTGQGSTNDVTIKNDADGEVMGVLTGSTTAAFTGQVTATGFTGTLDGILGSGTAAAVSGTTVTATGKVTAGAKLDMNGTELILDADADTSITADTDDTIDIRIAGADDFQFSANAFNVLSGSTLTIDSGATITNSGTANNFGTDSESAYAGVLQANANFVDQVIFGPAVDGTAWNGLWDKAGVYSSLMLATIEDEGSNTEINIWDLTQQSAGVISTTPLATVDLASAATPTAIAAAMGYLIVSSEDGIAIIDPHSGAWAERTVGWPRTLSSSTAPALTDNDVIDVAAGLSDAPPYDSRTGGPLPTFALQYGTGADSTSLIKDDGNVFDRSTAQVDIKGVAIFNGHLYYSLQSTNNNAYVTAQAISAIVADDWTQTNIIQKGGDREGLGSDNGLSVAGRTLALAGALGFSRFLINHGGYTSTTRVTAGALINRTYNTGYLVGDIRGAWIANSKTVDRSFKANTLTENGTVPTGAVASGAELTVYGPFTDSNNLTRASDADWDVIGTGSVYLSIWFNSTGPASEEHMLGFSNAAQTLRAEFYLNANDTITFGVGGASANGAATTTDTYGDSKWHKVDAVHVSTTERYVYVDGVLAASETTDVGSISSSGNQPLGIGIFTPSSGAACLTTKLALAHLSVGPSPTATQVREMYDGEKGMFVASAECLLQSGSTDAVLDVNVDPLSNKVIVTQTDAITIFDGLVVDSKPTVNSGASEKGNLWGDLRTEQNAANAYVTAPAVDQRQVNEMVRSLASDLPVGVDLGKAKAWVKFDGIGTVAIYSSYNIKSITDGGVGLYTFTFGVPFKTADYVAVSTGSASRSAAVDPAPTSGASIRLSFEQNNGSANGDTDPGYLVMFGELENE